MQIVVLFKVSDEVKGALNSADCGSTSTCVNILDIENSLESLSNWTLNLVITIVGRVHPSADWLICHRLIFPCKPLIGCRKNPVKEERLS